METKIITPQEAQELLDTKINDNTPFSSSMIEAILEDLNNGTFDKNEIKLVMYPDGMVCSGKHLLSAIVKYGKEVEIYVINREKNDVHSRGYYNNSMKYKRIYSKEDFENFRSKLK